MATTVLESELETNNNPTNIVREELADDVSHDVKALDTPSGDKEDILASNSIANTAIEELVEDSDVFVQDSNPEYPNNSSQLSRNGRGLRKFLSSAKERFDNIEPGWAQRKTSNETR
jgi:hypothetical protein